VKASHLQDENLRLKQIVTALTLDRDTLHALNSRIMTPGIGDRSGVIENQTLRDRITRILAFMILRDKRTGPNRVLGSEVGLARHFKVSRTVLREAVKVLQGKGMVEGRPKTGIHIRPRTEWSLLDAELIEWQCAIGLDEGFVRNLTGLRMLIEPAAAETAAAEGTDDELQAIYEWHMKEHDQSNLEACVNSDLGFHRAILLATHNDLLIHVGQNVLNAIRASIVYRNRQVIETYSFKLHRQVAEAIMSRNRDAARAAMKRLVKQAEQDFYERIKAAGGEATERLATAAELLRQIKPRRHEELVPRTEIEG